MELYFSRFTNVLIVAGIAVELYVFDFTTVPARLKLIAV